MATPRLVEVRDFNTSRFSQLADTSSANIADILARAEKAIESKLHRPLVATMYTESHRPHGNKLYLRYRPIILVDSVTRSSGFLSSVVDNYTVDPNTGILYTPIPQDGYILTVVYKAGFEEVPEDIKEAILMQAALMAFTDLEIYGSGDSKEPGILYMRDDIDALLKPYKQLHTAF